MLFGTIIPLPAIPWVADAFTAFTDDQLRALSYFCHKMNSSFNTERWHDYIAGKCGPNGGKI